MKEGSALSYECLRMWYTATCVGVPERPAIGLEYKSQALLPHIIIYISIYIFVLNTVRCSCISKSLKSVKSELYFSQMQVKSR